MLATLAGALLGFVLGRGLDGLAPIPPSFDRPAILNLALPLFIGTGVLLDTVAFVSARVGSLPKLALRDAIRPILVAIALSLMGAGFGAFVGYGTGKQAQTLAERGQIRSLRQSIDKHEMSAASGDAQIDALQRRIASKPEDGRSVYRMRAVVPVGGLIGLIAGGLGIAPYLLRRRALAVAGEESSVAREAELPV